MTTKKNMTNISWQTIVQVFPNFILIFFFLNLYFFVMSVDLKYLILSDVMWQGIFMLSFTTWIEYVEYVYLLINTFGRNIV